MAVFFIFYIAFGKFNKRFFSFADIEYVEKVGDRLRIIRTRTASDYYRHIIAAVFRVKRQTGKLKRIKNISIAHFILQCKADYVKILKSVSAFMCIKRNFLAHKNIAKVLPWSICALAPDILIAVKRAVKNFYSEIRHAYFIRIGKTKRESRFYISFIFYCFIKLAPGISARLLHLL